MEFDVDGGLSTCTTNGYVCVWLSGWLELTPEMMNTPRLWAEKARKRCPLNYAEKEAMDRIFNMERLYGWERENLREIEEAYEREMGFIGDLVEWWENPNITVEDME